MGHRGPPNPTRLKPDSLQPPVWLEESRRAIEVQCDAERATSRDVGTVATQGLGRLRRNSVARRGGKKRQRDARASNEDVDDTHLVSKTRCKPKRRYRCSGCQKNGHSLAHCPRSPNLTPHVCSRCKNSGHNARTCTAAATARSNGSTSKESLPRDKAPAAVRADEPRAQTQLKDLLKGATDSDHEAPTAAEEKQQTLTQLGSWGENVSARSREDTRDSGASTRRSRPCRVCGSVTGHSTGTQCPFSGAGTSDE